jgi:hypothetical protein
LTKEWAYNWGKNKDFNAKNAKGAETTYADERAEIKERLAKKWGKKIIIYVRVSA